MAGEAQQELRDMEARVAVVTGGPRNRQTGRGSAGTARASVAGRDIAGPVSPILDYAPATARDRRHRGRQRKHHRLKGAKPGPLRAPGRLGSGCLRGMP